MPVEIVLTRQERESLEAIRRERRERRLTWGPKGRVVESGTGNPLPWWTVWIQVRRREAPAIVETRGLNRGVVTAEDAEACAAFDLEGAEILFGRERLGGESPAALEYRVGARAGGHRSAATAWKPLPEGQASGDLTIELEPDPLSTLFVRVRNEDGTPYCGHVSASVMDGDLEFHAGISADTNAEGVARLQQVPSGEFEVRLAIHRRESWSWQAGTILTEWRRVSLPAEGDAEAEFTVPATGEIAIDWTDSEGTPLKGNWTQVEARGSYSAHVERIVGLPAGPAKLTLRVKGHRTWKSTVQVVAGQVTRVEARFEPGEDPK